MKTRRQKSDTPPVTVWTPWGPLSLAKDESRRSKFRKRLDARRRRRSERPRLTDKDRRN